MELDIVRMTEGLTADMAEAGYRQGVFPMGHGETGLVTWHRPRRRAVIELDRFHVSRSLARTMRAARYTVTVNRAFRQVMAGCADRGPEHGTWITSDIRTAYEELHRRGVAHALEVWVDGELAGGIYGVHLGGAFFAESKFHRVRDMSKVALAELVRRLRERGFALLEVQYLTPHLRQFGAVEITGREYQRRLERALAMVCKFV